jgi:hypothetical protein
MIIRRRRVRLQIEQTTLHTAFVHTSATIPAAPPVVDPGTSHPNSSGHLRPNLAPPSQEPRQ